jgi:hypothetical protein
MVEDFYSNTGLLKPAVLQRKENWRTCLKCSAGMLGSKRKRNKTKVVCDENRKNNILPFSFCYWVYNTFRKVNPNESCLRAEILSFNIR